MLQKLYAVLKLTRCYLHSKNLPCHLFGDLKPEKKMSLLLLLRFRLNLFPLSYLSGVKDHLLF